MVFGSSIAKMLCKDTILFPNIEQNDTTSDKVRYYTSGIKRKSKLKRSKADRKCEIGVGEGFVFECEMPPLAIERFETMGQHSIV